MAFRCFRSLPYRQLRKNRGPIPAFRACSLPYRQLRKILGLLLGYIISSLPYRQLRKDW
ncbi:hypothetical protein J520_2221 [Acinetobacter sp. 869535]|nr:hypothetical protein J520_2221 [Acinetobacter sp. 869535]